MDETFQVSCSDTSHDFGKPGNVPSVPGLFHGRLGADTVISSGLSVATFETKDLRARRFGLTRRSWPSANTAPRKLPGQIRPMSYNQDVLTEEDKQWISQRLEKVETALLTEFHKWASPVELRQKSHAAAIRALDTEVEAISDRLKNLEGR